MNRTKPGPSWVVWQLVSTDWLLNETEAWRSNYWLKGKEAMG